MKAPNGEAPAVAAAQGFGRVAQTVSHHSATAALPPLPPVTVLIDGHPVSVRPQWVDLHGRKASIDDPVRFRYLADMGGKFFGFDRHGYLWGFRGPLPLGAFGLAAPATGSTRGAKP